ncbi:MAG: hypothetical protein LBH04_03180 [Tannerellaceae bacterium]|jgi:hypothetical protein|nr:hypothetical protein [Tannerellaceae bacterium]
MENILNNPYRILGILAGASNNQIREAANRLIQLIKAGIPLPIDFSFPSLGTLNRTVDTVQEARSNLDTDTQKMQWSLFWFWNGYDITDEAAFESLKDNNMDIEHAFNVWNNVVAETRGGKRYWRDITERNFSAYHNLFVLEMLRQNGNKEHAIVANLKFIESGYFSSFTEKAIDKYFKTTAKEQQYYFLEEVGKEIKQKNSILTLPRFRSLLQGLKFVSKDDFFKQLHSTQTTEDVKAEIQKAKSKRAKSKREEKPSDTYTAGKALHENTKKQLDQIKAYCEELHYTSVADEVAIELRLCSIDFFNKSNDYKKAKELITFAKDTAAGMQLKVQIENDMKNLDDIGGGRKEEEPGNGKKKAPIGEKPEGKINIEAEIAICRKKREDKAAAAYDAGKTLYENTKDILRLLNELADSVEKIPNMNDFRKTLMKMANEVVQELVLCSGLFFDYCHKNVQNEDFYVKVIHLLDMAKSIADDSNKKQILALLKKVKETALLQKIAFLKEVKKMLDWLHNNNMSRYESLSRNVVKSIQMQFPDQIVGIIKESTNNKQLSKYKKLVDTVFKLLYQPCVPEVSYLKWWKKIPWFLSNAWWIFGFIGGVIGVIVGGTGPIIIGVTAGIVLGWIVKAASK